MPVVEFEGKTTEEAIEMACSHLHLAKDELKFEIITTGSSGIFGLLAGKKARIRVHIEEKLTGRGGAESEPLPSPAEAEEAQPRQPRPSRSEERKPRPERRAERPPRQRQPRPEAPPAEAAPEAIETPGPEDAATIQAREVLEGILSRIPIKGEIRAARLKDRIVLNIQGENSGLLIGKKGATLDALQFLVNKIVNRVQPDKHHVVVDTGNYRQRRQDSLVALARRMADKARRTKRAVTISALSAHDRRVVHLALKDEPGLSTRSKGDGAYKRVIIIPEHARKGAPAVEEIVNEDLMDAADRPESGEAFDETVREPEEENRPAEVQET